MNEIPWNMYPRPQMRRDSFLNLNGEWDLTIVDGAYEEPHIILVPYPPESELSMLSRRIHPEEELIYRKRFTLPDGFLRDPSDRVLLHFGAVDQSCKVTLNDSPVGAHSGGYSHFSFEVGASLNYGEENELVSACVTSWIRRPGREASRKRKTAVCGIRRSPASGKASGSKAMTKTASMISRSKPMIAH